LSVAVALGDAEDRPTGEEAVTEVSNRSFRRALCAAGARRHTSAAGRATPRKARGAPDGIAPRRRVARGPLSSDCRIAIGVVSGRTRGVASTAPLADPLRGRLLPQNPTVGEQVIALPRAAAGGDIARHSVETTSAFTTVLTTVGRA